RRQRAGEAAGLEAQRVVRLRDDRLRGVLRVGGVGVLVVEGERLDQLELAEGGEVRVERELLLVAAVDHEDGQLARLLVPGRDRVGRGAGAEAGVVEGRRIQPHV